MRLPQKGDAIDIEQVKEMVDMFMEAGFTYFDTAWAYAGSEDAIRQALVERYPRDSYRLATKNAAWIDCKTKEEAYSQLDVSLKQTGAGFLIFICRTIWVRADLITLMIMICGTGCRRKRKKGLFVMWDFPFILHRKSWKRS